MTKAFFLDKDGTLVDNSGYPNIIPSDEILFDDVIEGLKHIQSKGYELFIVSNQPWIAKNKLSEQETENIFKNLIKTLEREGIFIKDYIYCPHQTLDKCDCKKPSPKMILDLACKYDIKLEESFIVGDSDQDILAGVNAGIKTILVLTGIGKNFKDSSRATYILKNLNEINKII